MPTPAAFKELKVQLASRGVLDARLCLGTTRGRKPTTSQSGAAFFGVSLPGVHSVLELLPHSTEAMIIPKGAWEWGRAPLLLFFPQPPLSVTLETPRRHQASDLYFLTVVHPVSNSPCAGSDWVKYAFQYVQPSFLEVCDGRLLAWVAFIE
jgi:hypothetical protein